MDPGRKSERHTDTNTLQHTQTPFECASRGSERRRSTLATAPIHPDTEPLLFGKEKSIHLLSAIHVFSNNQSTKTGYWGAFYSANCNHDCNRTNTSKNENLWGLYLAVLGVPTPGTRKKKKIGVHKHMFFTNNVYIHTCCVCEKSTPDGSKAKMKCHRNVCVCVRERESVRMCVCVCEKVPHLVCMQESTPDGSKAKIMCHCEHLRRRFIIVLMHLPQCVCMCVCIYTCVRMYVCVYVYACVRVST